MTPKYLTPSAFGKILSKTHKDMGPNKFCRWLLDNNFAFRISGPGWSRHRYRAIR
jgi:hypothetical protein